MAGRPPTYQSDAERPVSVSLRVPKDLHDEAQQYANMHRMTLTELLLDGLRLRLETPADPREAFLSDNSNTVMQQLQPIVAMLFQAEVAKLRSELLAAPTDALHTARNDIPHYSGNTVSHNIDTQEIEAQRALVQATLKTGRDQPTDAIQSDNRNTVIQETAAAVSEAGKPQRGPYGAFMPQVQAFAAQRRSFTCDEAAKALAVQPKKAWRALQTLVDRGSLRVEGSRKSAVYHWCAVPSEAGATS